MNLVEKLGASYFSDWCGGALFLHDGKIMKVGVPRDSDHDDNYDDEEEPSRHRRRIFGDDDSVMCALLNGEGEELPQNFFTGWKIFEHPQLGYRKINGLCRVLRKRQTAYRGLRRDSIEHELTPASSYLFNSTSYRGTPLNLNSVINSVFLPEWDKIDMLDDLLSGEVPGLVLSGEWLLEPPVRGQEDVVNIYQNARVVGSIASDKTFRWTNQRSARAFARVTKEAA